MVSASVAPLASPRIARCARALLVALVCTVAVSVLTAVGLVLRGERVTTAVRATALGHAVDLLPLPHTDAPADDSWGPMLRVLAERAARPGASLYTPVLRDTVKFQYPPTALLPLLPMAAQYDVATGRIAPSLYAGLRTVVYVAAWACIALVAWLALSALPPEALPTSRDRRLAGAAAVLLAATFYPLARGVALGQVQVLLDAGVALSLLAFLVGRRATAGAALAVCALVKPQFALVGAWALLRGERRVLAAFLVVIVAGLGTSVAVFGLAAHLDYLRVLRLIAERGEVFWANHSLNGLLHRALGSDDPLAWRPNAYAPSVPAIRWATTVGALACLAWALRPLPDVPARGRVLDLATLLVAATIASPVVWDHHYGVLLPVFALLFAATVATPAVDPLPARPLLLAYLLVACAMLQPWFLLRSPWTAPLVSHAWFGALAVLVLARRAAASTRRAAAPVLVARPAQEEVAPSLGASA